MIMTVTRIVEPTSAPADHQPETADRAGSAQLAGFGGLAFVATVVLQNAIRSQAPAADASAADITTYFRDHRTVEWLLVATFIVGAVALTTFLGGLWTAFTGADRRTQRWGRTGVLAAGGVLTMFSTLVACEVALLAATNRDDLASAVPVVWLLHNAVFSILPVFIGIALFGLSRAGAGVGLVSPAIAKVALGGSALLLAGAAFAPAVTEDNHPGFVITVVGFVGWLVFVATTGWRLRRR